MFGLVRSFRRNEWKWKRMLRSPMVVFASAFIAPVAIVLLVATVINAPAPVSATSSNLEGTEYCYTSEDGDWLICRLKE